MTLEDVLELPRTQLVSFDGSVGSAVARLERSADVLDAQPNYRYRASAPPRTTPSSASSGASASRPAWTCFPAWDRTRGAGQVIAVVDSGVDLTHPDLLGNLWAESRRDPGNGLDDDGNGKVDDMHGYDFVDADR